MLSSVALVVFREVFEMSLIISIVLATTREISGRGRWVGFGIGLGLAGSVLLAFAAHQLQALLEGAEQEIFQAILLLITAFFIIWTVLWMRLHGNNLRPKLQRITADADPDNLALIILMLVVALAVLREGAEIVIFLTGIMLAKQLSLTAMLSGAMLGGGVAASIGIALYYGIITFSRLRIVLQISNIFLLCLSAGLAGQAANFLAAADVLPELSSQLWDSAWLLSEHSFIGQLCAVLFGYSDHPTGIQMVFYGSTLALALAGYSYTNRIIAARRHA